MMYSLFIFFLTALFAKWWLDQSPHAKHTRLMVVLAAIGILSYGLFVSSIDRKRMNFNIIHTSCFVANLCISLCLGFIMLNIKRIEK